MHHYMYYSKEEKKFKNALKFSIMYMYVLYVYIMKLYYSHFVVQSGSNGQNVYQL